MDKEQKLAEVKKTMKNKLETPLKKHANHLVFGVGPPDAKMVMIGEGPGKHEDEQGEPFVGRSGKLLDALMSKAGFERSDVYITNTVKHRPPRDRTPTEKEVDLEEPFLKHQLTVVDPNVIVTVGRFAAQRVTDINAPLHHFRGDWWPSKYDDRPVQVIYHPSYILRQQDDELTKDLCENTVRSLKEAWEIADDPSAEVRFANDRENSVDPEAAESVLSNIDAEDVELD